MSAGRPRAAWVLASAGAGVWLAAFLWARLGASDRLYETLQWLSPLAWVTLAALAAGAAVAGRVSVWQGMGALGRRSGLILAAVLLATLLARLVLVPGHERVYYDEHTYVQIARAIAAEGRSRVTGWGTITDGRLESAEASYPFWPAGWPTVLAGGLRLTGSPAPTGRAINQALSLGTSLLAGLIAALWLGSPEAGLAAALLHACIPSNALWSRTTASEPLAAFLAAAAFFVAAVHASRPTLRSFWLLATTVALAGMARNEAVLIVPLAAVAATWGTARGQRGWRAPDWRTAAAIAGVSLVLLVPQALHIGLVSRHYGSAPSGAGLSVGFLGGNVHSLLRYLKGEPVVLTVVALAAAEVLRRDAAVRLGPVILWLGATLGVPLFYFAGSYLYPGGERFTLAWLVPCAVLAAGALLRIAAGLRAWISAPCLTLLGAAAIGGSLVWLGPYAARQDRETQVPRADVAFLRSALDTAPARSVVVTADPCLVLAEGHSAVFVVTAGSNPERARSLATRYDGGVFLFTAPSSSAADWPGGPAAMDVVLTAYRPEDLLREPSSSGERTWSRLVLRALPDDDQLRGVTSRSGASEGRATPRSSK